MKNKALMLLVLIVALVGLVARMAYHPPTVAASAWAQKVDQWVLDTAVTNADGQTEFLVYLKEQADLSQAAQLDTKLAKGQYVFEQLTATAERTQAPLLAQLAREGVAYQSFWVANMVWVRGDLNVVQAMAQRDDVAHIYANPTVKLDMPTPEQIAEDNANLENTVNLVQAIEWNITKIGAPLVWAAGNIGQGAVIGGQDTGYDWTHPAIKGKYRGWNGTTANHNYNWHDAIHTTGSSCGANSPVPCDDNGHGTHTMGTMVGDDGGSNQIGVAPGAKWIGCRNMNAGNGTPATYSECYQWFVAPTDLNNQNPDPSKAPDVINNSWSCPASEGCTDPNVMLTVVQNLRAAGIVSAHAASNAGPSCSTVADPATIYAESFSVGSTTSTDAISGFSSRGPVTSDGSNRRKPDVSAPGSSVRSSIPGGGYSTLSGTSMAAPHVAGLVGLLVAANPSLAGHVDEIEHIIEQTAVHFTTTQGCGGDGSATVPNNVFGWGRIDANAAFLLAWHPLSLQTTATPNPVPAGTTLMYNLILDHSNPVSDTHHVVITDVIPSGTTFVTATMPFTLTGNTITWHKASMGPNESWPVFLGVNVAMTATGTIQNEGYEARSDEGALVRGEIINTAVLPFGFDLVKTTPADYVLAGAPISYTLTFTNIHPSLPAQNVILADTIPTNTTFLSATMPYTFDGSVVRWSVASAEAGTPHSVTLWLTTDANATGWVVNKEYAVWSDEVLTPQIGAPVQTPVLQSNVWLTKSAPNYVAPGEPITYTLVVANVDTTVDLHHLVLSDTLPSRTTFVAASGTYTTSGTAVTWTAPALAAQQSWTVTLTVLTNLTATGIITNSNYAVDSDEIMTPTTGLPVTTALIPYGLEIHKSANVTSTVPGDIITYTLTITNLHPVTATHNIVITDELPVGTTFITATQSYTIAGNLVFWDNPSLAAGASWHAALVVQVPLTTTATAVVNDHYAVWSDEVAAVHGTAVTVAIQLGHFVYLPLILHP